MLGNCKPVQKIYMQVYLHLEKKKKVIYFEDFVGFCFVCLKHLWVLSPTIHLYEST